MHRITLLLPDSFDEVMRQARQIALGPPGPELPINHDARTAYIVAIVACVVERMDAPIVAEAITRLNHRTMIPRAH